MITLKEMLAEPHTMYDGGMVQHMAEGGEPEIKFQEGQPIEIDGRKFPSLVTAEGTSPKKLYRYASPQEWKEIIETGERIYDDPKEIAFQLFITLDGLGLTKKDINYIADELKNNNDLIKMRKYGSDRDGITYICR